MKITKYAGKSCVKCRIVDQVFKLVTLPCEVETIYVEDEGNEAFMSKGIESLPTIVFENENDKIMLTGTITPKMINEAIEKLKD